VPFTLGLLEELGCKKSSVAVLVLQTVAANLGSMATPVGNPQNLYLYSRYEMAAGDFFAVVLPPAALSMLALGVLALFALPKTLPAYKAEEAALGQKRALAVYAALFALALLSVFRLLPWEALCLLVILAAAVLDRELLRRADYALLLTFVCFFVVSENLGRVEAVRDFLQTLLGKNTLLTAVGASQVISNVPAAVLLSGFTNQWQGLLAGVNIGGLGTPIASLASLITLKLYLRSENAEPGRFLLFFTAANVAYLVLLLVFV
jgi:Na+/H+ antiporter NhaD/arsenite permease-like protein